MMPIARSVDRNLKFPLVPSSLACPLSPPWTVSNRYMITPVGAGLGAATQRSTPNVLERHSREVSTAVDVSSTDYVPVKGRPC